MMDRLLEILGKEPEYRAFHLDSQTIVLEDYLGIRPQKRELIKKYVQEGRLLIGPWFILPEEFEVGGENLIRNLLLGHKIAEDFGHVMKVGYSPFSWGQISQLPQIYKGFGIDIIMFYRGINSLDSPKAEFIWEGADGTRALTSRFSTMPRYNFYFYIYRPVIHNEAIADVEYSWTKGGLPFHFADSAMQGEDYNLLNPGDDYHGENIPSAVQSIIEKQAGDFTTPHIFWAEGHDSSGPNPKTVRLIKDIRQILGEDEVRHSTLEDYAKGLMDSADVQNLKTVHGERRSSQYDLRSGNLYGYTTSARMYLKQANFTTEKWLQFYAEPFNALAGLLGLDTDDRYINLAWHYLIQNSAHDSIGGCSLDEIHEDMMFRFRQAQQISKGVFARACKHLAPMLNTGSHSPESIHLTAVNTMLFSRDEIAEVFIDIPASLDKGAVSVKDMTGNRLDLQMLGSGKSEPILEQMTDRPMYFSMRQYHCYLRINQIPAFGLKTLSAVPVEPEIEANSAALARMENGQPILENERLRIAVNSDGTFDLLEKVHQRPFKNLGYFEDEGEEGHAWVHKPCGPVINTKGSLPEITFVLNGPLISVCRIRHKISIPANLESRLSSLCDAELHIELDITLKSGSPLAEFNIRVQNPAESHRLRMMFPTNLRAGYAWGEGQFDVVARPTARPDTTGWVEQPMYDYPLHHFADISSGSHGLALLVDGLKEYEICDDPSQTMAVTLFRAFTYVIQPASLQDFSWQKGSQCLGNHEYRLAISPHEGDWQKAGIYKQAMSFNNEIRVFQTSGSRGMLKPETSFLRIMPEDLVFSCLKQPEKPEKGKLILRFYNPTDKEITGTIESLLDISSAEILSLEEIKTGEPEVVRGNSIVVKALPKKIITLGICFKPVTG